MQLRANAPGNWAPVTHMVNEGGILGSWIQPGMDLAVLTVGEVSRYMDDNLSPAFPPV